MKILVTGGAGFIGSHVADGYIENNHETSVIDNLSEGKIENLNPKAKFYLTDICAAREIDKIFSIEKPDIVNHHAAQISVPESVKNPACDAQVNVIGFLNILQACVKHKVKKVIFISSGGAIYGEAEEYPTTENYIPKPLSPYAITKYASEKYLYFYNHQFGLNYTVLRYSNVYGPRQVPHGEAGVVSIFIEKLMNNITPAIYAYEDEPGGMIRDYVFVHDAVRANILALDGGNNEIINICTNKETSTMELYDEVCKAMNKKIKPEKFGPRPGDLKHSCLNNSKAKKVLDWTPQISLSSGIMKTCEFFLKK
jgi:UDP-glucose 4-epimerase